MLDRVTGQLVGRRSTPRNRGGNQFVTKNLNHACNRYQLEDAFRGKPPGIRRLFDGFRQMVEDCGPVILLPYRDKVGFMGCQQLQNIGPTAVS